MFCAQNHFTTLSASPFMLIRKLFGAAAAATAAASGFKTSSTDGDAGVSFGSTSISDDDDDVASDDASEGGDVAFEGGSTADAESLSSPSTTKSANTGLSLSFASN